MWEIKKGLEIQQRLLKKGIKSNLVYYNLSRTYYLISNYQKSLEHINKAIEIKPDFDAYNLKWNILNELKDTKWSLEAYEQAKSFNTDKSMLYYNIWLTYYDAWEYEKAIENFKEWQKYISQEKYDFYTQIAYSYLKLEDYKNTISNIELAAENDPYSPEIYYILWWYYLQIKKYEESRKYFKKFINDTKDSDEWNHARYIAHYNIWVVEYHLKNYAVSLKIIQTLIEKKPNDLDLYTLKEEVLKEME